MSTVTDASGPRVRAFPLFGRWMNHLSYPQKFLLISTVFILPLSLLLYFFVKEVDDRIDFARKERMGTGYVRPLYAMLLHGSQAHADALGFAAGRVESRPAMVRSLAQMSASFAQIERNQRRHGAALETDNGFSILSENWSFLKKGLLADKMANPRDLFASLEGDIRDLLAQVVNTSNLILDPDLDTYFLMDATVLKWPRVEDLLTQTRLLAGGVLARQALAPDEKAELAALSGVLRSLKVELARGVETAFQNTRDAQLAPALRPSLTAAMQALEDYQAFLKQHFLDRDPQDITFGGLGLEEFEPTFSRAVQTNYYFTGRALDTLDRLLDHRIADFQDRRNAVLLAVGVLLGLAACLFSAFYAGVMRTVSAIGTTARRLEEGHFGDPVALESRDELGQVVTSFNAVAAQLRREYLLAKEESARAQAAEGSLQADIARREAAERALAQTHAELELRVEQRTGELRAAHARLQEELAERERAESDKARLEAQLRQAQKLEAIGTLAGGIAHDFNNILGAIVGYAEMALDAAPAGKLQRYLGNVMAAANRAKDLVDQILAFTQPGSRERVPVRMGPLLGEVAELIKASLPETIELNLRVNAEDATVQGDVIRLHQLLMNVCTNAVQAMPEGGLLEIALDVIELSERMVQRHHTIEPGAYVRLKVTDTGHGIDEATLDRVFDPFFTTKDLGQGTGLGLSLAHSIVSDHGGAIEVSSTPGQGSRFTVYLPRSLETASASGIERVPIPKGRGETVLLVDDDEALVLLGEEMIAALGYEPVGFQDSQAALEAFQARPARFDLVVTDQLMPRMSGTELATRLREIRPDIPVLLMSGFGGPELAHKARRAAVHALLKKPLQSRDLAYAIAGALNVNKKLGADSRQ